MKRFTFLSVFNFCCISLILLTVFMQSGLMVFIHQVRHSLHKVEMAEWIKKSDREFQQLVMSIEKFESVKVDENEICIDGEMFDISEVRFADDNVILSGYFDKKEKSILKIIEEIIEGQTDSSGSKNENFKVHYSDYLSVKTHVMSFEEEIDKILCSFFFSAHISKKTDVVSPPPEFS